MALDEVRPGGRRYCPSGGFWPCVGLQPPAGLATPPRSFEITPCLCLPSSLGAQLHLQSLCPPTPQLIQFCPFRPLFSQMVMEDIFISSDPLLESVGLHEPLVEELRSTITNALRKAMIPLQAYAKEYRKYLELNNNDISSFLKCVRAFACVRSSLSVCVCPRPPCSARSALTCASCPKGLPDAVSVGRRGAGGGAHPPEGEGDPGQLAAQQRRHRALLHQRRQRQAEPVQEAQGPGHFHARHPSQEPAQGGGQRRCPPALPQRPQLHTSLLAEMVYSCWHYVPRQGQGYLQRPRPREGNGGPPS